MLERKEREAREVAERLKEEHNAMEAEMQGRIDELEVRRCELRESKTLRVWAGGDQAEGLAG
eukprot:370222-Hanusia_phi.AAC.5